MNISSISAFVSTQWSGAYEMSKHAVESYSDTLALNLSNYGVTINLIEPGTYRTRIGPKGLEGTRQRVDTRTPVIMKSEIPIRLTELEKEVEDEKNFPTPGEVAEVIMDALFSERPRRRYMPCPIRTEFVSSIEGPIRRSVQANLGGGRFSLARKEIHDLLDRIWDEEWRSSSNPSLALSSETDGAGKKPES